MSENQPANIPIPKPKPVITTTTNFDPKFISLPVKIKKRPLLVSTNSEDSINSPAKNTKVEEPPNNDNTKINPLILLNTDTHEISKRLSPAMNFVNENFNKYKMDFDSLTTLLVELKEKNKKQILSTGRKYTRDLGFLGLLLNEVYQRIEDRNLRNRISKHIKIFSENYVLSQDDSDVESQLSIKQREL